MTHEPTSRRLDRRSFFKLGGAGVLTLAVAGGLGGALSRGGASDAVAAHVTGTQIRRRLVATDGFIHLPNRPGLIDVPVPGHRDVFTFGFREALAGPGGDFPAYANANEIPMYDLTQFYKGNVFVTSPHLAIDQGDELFLTLTNVGFSQRPDLDDSHTIHWHGFRNPIALFDGTPELSIAVPPYRDFIYYYKAADDAPGTYIYHCHFEDTEHVQLTMTGIVWIRPAQNGESLGGFTKFVYNDGDGSTGYVREFALLLSEVDVRPHDGLLHIQEFVWSDYEPQYWIINGRTYPNTIEPNRGEAGWSSAGIQADLDFQPHSSLVQCNEGERVLLRMANLGFQQHAMQVPGIALHVVGEDATLLRGPGGADLSYDATTIYIAPGESRDALFTAPPYDGGAAETDPARPGAGPFNRYFLRNRNLEKLVNGSAPGGPDPESPGGMQTEVRVHPAGAIGAQTYPNQTYA